MRNTAILVITILLCFGPSSVHCQIWDYYEDITLRGLFKKEYVVDNKIRSCTIHYSHIKDSVVKTAYVSEVYKFDKKGNVSKIFSYVAGVDSLEDVFTYHYDQNGNLIKKNWRRINDPEGNTTEKFYYRNNILQESICKFDKSQKIFYRVEYLYNLQNKLIFTKDTFTGDFSIFRYDDEGYQYEYFLSQWDFPRSQLNSVETVTDVNAFVSIFEKKKENYIKFKDGRMIENGGLREKFYYLEDGRVDSSSCGKYGRNAEKVVYENKVPVKLTYKANPETEEYEIHIITYRYY